MKKSNRFSPEVLERAVRMGRKNQEESPLLRASIESIAPKIGSMAQTLREWVKPVEVDTGLREGVNTSETQRVWAPK